MTPTSPPCLRAAPQRLTATALLMLTGGLAGCSSSPLAQSTEAELRRSMLEALKREVAHADPTADGPRRLATPSPDTTKLEIRPEHIAEIEAEFSTPADFALIAGRVEEGEDPAAILAGLNLMGRPTTTAGVSLERAIQTAVANNLDAEFARYAPAINQATIVEAEAAFDWLLFGSASYQDSALPRAGQGFGDTPPGVIREQSTSWAASAGLRRTMTTGGSLGLTHTIGSVDVDRSFFGTDPQPNPARNANFEVELNQPLLRGFGERVNLAEIRLARNAERASVSDLRAELIRTVTETERAYWTLVQRYQELVILTRLLERGEQVRDDILARRVQDARQAQVADAVARTERRRADVLRARQSLRRASDDLKRLVNDPNLPVGSEVLLVPMDLPTAEEVTVSLLDAITTAVAERPDLDRALLSIDDAQIREQVARNLRRPRLDLQARARMLGLDDSLGDAYEDSVANRFIDDWLIGLGFEQPLGNRAGEAAFRRSRLQRMQSVVGYRRAVQGVVLDVKNSLDAVITNHSLIEQSSLSRIAQGEALRTLGVEKELTNLGYTVERLNVELNQQESLAQAQIAEVTAVINYNIALADLFAAMGTTLERSRIDLIVPDANQLEPGESPMDYMVDPAPRPE
ncbi:MAG: TolC family protein [Phycisphaerales bacterium]|nr:TolC family protein [Planctomycetota bacterium]MCH8509777.1 TolC family protein [Phycisphaerales bacterium]